MRPLCSVTFAAAALLPATLVSGALVQKPGILVPESYAQYKDAVKDIFLRSYEAYKEYAWGHDDLTPETKSYYDGRNGWGASIVDSLGTMHIMGLDELFLEAVDFSSQIDFSESKTPEYVSVFETTIRYLGGLISAYEMSDFKYPALLDKAVEVADKMAVAWAFDNDVPWGFLNFTDNTPDMETTSNIAEAGTLLLEWRSLSEYSKNETYGELALKSMNRIANNEHVLTGLPSQGIDPLDGNPVGSYVNWGGGSDSYYEYLLKYSRLTNIDNPFFVDEWLTAIDTTIKFLLRTSTIGSHLYTCSYDGEADRIRYLSSHLTCFHGGNWIMGGKLTNNETIVDYGLQLVEGCWNTYAGTVTGIGPEVVAFKSEDGDYTGYPDPSEEDEEFYQENGFYQLNTQYVLRPEVIESNFYAWRATGDTKYLDRAVAMIDSINTHLRGDIAYDSIEDVTIVDSERLDDMESFWFAEVLKYLYLTFDDPEHINIDEYVFTTEAHPLKAPPPKDQYGSKVLHTQQSTSSTTASETSERAPPAQISASGRRMEKGASVAGLGV